MGLLERTADRRGRWPTRRHRGQRRLERDHDLNLVLASQSELYDLLGAATRGAPSEAPVRASGRPRDLEDATAVMRGDCVHRRDQPTA